MAEKNQRIHVLRNFWHAGKQVGIGSVLDLPISTAAELRSAAKAEFVQGDAPLVEKAPPPKPPRGKPQTELLLETLVEAVKQQGDAIKSLVAALGKSKG
jgi:hypothetical protein